MFLRLGISELHMLTYNEGSTERAKFIITDIQIITELLHLVFFSRDVNSVCVCVTAVFNMGMYRFVLFVNSAFTVLP